MRKYIVLTFIIVLFVGVGRLSGQNSVADRYLNAGTKNFDTIRQTMEAYFANRDHGRGSGYTQWKRWEYMAERRLTPDGKVADWAVRNWIEYQNYVEAHPNIDGSDPDANNGYWQNLGPYGFTWGTGWNGGIGRINCIAFHPSDPNTFWVGTPAGGLWKTTNGGTNWTPLTDGMPVIGISGIAVNYNNPEILYILTGDGDGGQTRSIGVLKTINGGETWTTTGFNYNIYNAIFGFKLIIHPTNPQILFVVSNAGIHKTSNGGTTWASVQSGVFQDIEFKPGDPTIMYATGGTQFYRSVNSGNDWVRIYAGLPTTAARMAIGVTPDAMGYVYLFTGPPTAIGHFTGVFLSTNSGVDFYTRSTTPNLLGYDINGLDTAEQTTYDLCTAVSRTDNNKIIVGGINTWASGDWGSSWSITSMWDNTGSVGYTHADIHNLDINPLNNYLYCVSDGGVFRSTDFGLNWTDLTPGIAITQWYKIAGFQGNVNLLVGGTQDNGSNKWVGGSTMEHVQGADGGDCMIDHTNSDILYVSRQYGALVKSTDAGASWFWAKPGVAGPFVTPYVMNPTNSNVIYGGYNAGVYKSSNGGTSWTNVGADGRSALAIGTSNSSVVYAAGSTVKRSDNAGTSWTNVTAGLPAGFVTSMAVDPDNSSSVFIAFGGYSGGQKVYHSSNGGAAWTNISGTLPNVPVDCIAFDDNDGSPANAIYVGTDIGVFYRDNNHSDWIPFRNGLPTVPVFDIEINQANNVITVGSFGRGLWRSELYSACPGDYTLYPSNDPSNPNSTGFQFYEASNSVFSSRVITGGLGTDVTYKSNNYIKLGTGFNAKEHNLFQAKLGPCGLGAPMLNKVIKVRGTFVDNK